MLIDFIHGYTTRLHAVAAAALPLIAYYVRDLSTGLILALVAAALGTGEAVQRVEDRKTDRPLLREPPHVDESGSTARRDFVTEQEMAVLEARSRAIAGYA